jgi:methyl-accepting chemotaxis protein
MRGRLICLFLAVALVPLAIAGTVALIQFNTAEAAIEEVGHHHLPQIITLHQIETAMWHIVEAQKDYILASDETAKAAMMEEIEEKQQTLTVTRAEFEASLETDTEKEAFQTLKSSLDTFLEINDQVLLLSQNNDNEAAQALSASKGRDSLEEVADLIAEIGKTNEAETKKAEEDAHGAARTGTRVMFVVMAVAAIVVAVVAYFVAGSLTKPLLAVAEVAQKLALGDVGQSLQIKKRDEIGLMVAAFNRMIGYQQ